MASFATARRFLSPIRLRKSLMHRYDVKRDIKTLTVNSGSTTLKYSLYEVNRKDGASTALDSKLIASGLVDKVGTNENGYIKHNNSLVFEGEPINDHTEGFGMLLNILKEKENIDTNEIECVGHRVVHGGADFSEPTIITGEVLAEIKTLSSLAPLHNPPALSGIKACKHHFPEATQVAVFDTAFHTTMSASSYRYAIPKKLYKDHAIRKYGFHGTSYKYVMNATANHLGKKPADLNLIVMHLGGGASMCCIKNGVSIDTTMGLTPLEGLVMATRSGDIDPGVYDYLLKNGYTVDDVYKTLNKESGLQGLAGLSSDMRIISEKASEGNSDCQLARGVFAERCRKYLGSYFLKLCGDVDAVVFTGGIGEGDADMREMILKGLQENLQIGIDQAKNKNAVAPDDIMDIHPAFSKIKVLVVPTDEEISIAMQSSELVLPKNESESPGSLPQLNEINSNLFCHSLANTYSASEEVGLLSIFAAHADKIGYFRPIARESRGPTDYRVQLMKEHFGLSDDESEMYGVDEEQAYKMIIDGKEDELIELIIQKYLEYSAKKDFVVVSTFTEGDDSLHWAAKLCSTLNIPAIVIGDEGHDKNLGIAKSAFESHGAECLGVIVSDIEDIEAERKNLLEQNSKPLALIPPSPVLSRRTTREVLEILDDGACLYGAENLDVPIEKMWIHTMQVSELLPNLKNGQLAIMSHNRVDVAMSLLLAAQSANCPDIAGILFTAYKSGDMNPKIVSILNGLQDIRVPIIATSLDTFEAAKKIEATPTFMTAESKEKLDAAATLIEEHLDYSLLERFKGAALCPKRDIRPRLFQFSTFQKARQLRKSIVLPEGADPRVVEAAAILVKRKLCKVILVGKNDVIQKNAKKARVTLDGITICDPQHYDGMQDMIDAFVDARKSKGLTPLEAEKYLLQDVNYFGTMMMHLGKADGMVSGAMHSSANTIRPALQILKTSPSASIVSSIFFMLLEDGVKVFGDCAINVDPTAEQLAEIAVGAAKSSIQFGIEPRVALLSYATGDSNTGDMIDKVIKATQLAKKAAVDEGFMDPECIEGPLQFDAAVDPAVAAVKAKDSKVAGRANVLIFPDLNAGNNGYKAVQQASKTIAVGPVLQGLKKPVNDLSRGATVDDIVNTAVMTALQANDM